MTNRVTFRMQDLQDVPKQIERDHESKRLVVLLDRVKRQIAVRRDHALRVEAMKRPAAAVSSDSVPPRLSIAPVPAEE